MSGKLVPALRATPFAKAMTDARVRAGKTQAQAAKAIGVGSTMLTNIESGVSMTSEVQVKILAAFYGCTAEPLLHARAISLSSFILPNRDASSLRSETGLALQDRWESLDDATLKAIGALVAKGSS